MLTINFLVIFVSYFQYKSMHFTEILDYNQAIRQYTHIINYDCIQQARQKVSKRHVKTIFPIKFTQNNIEYITSSTGKNAIIHQKVNISHLFLNQFSSFCFYKKRESAILSKHSLKVLDLPLSKKGIGKKRAARQMPDGSIIFSLKFETRLIKPYPLNQER